MTRTHTIAHTAILIGMLGILAVSAAAFAQNAPAAGSDASNKGTFRPS